MKKNIQKATMGLFLSLGFLCLLEGFFEFIGIDVVSQSVVYQQNVSTWRLEGNLQNKRFKTPHDEHDFLVSTNSDGLRSSLSLKAQNVDIAFLGDSNMFGWGLDDSETYDALLQNKFPDVQFLNAGQPGHSSFQSYELFLKLIPKYKPKWTILLLSMHDHNRAPISDVERSGVVNGFVPHIRLWLHKHSRIYSLVRGLLITKSMNQADAKGETYRVRDEEREKLLVSMMEKAKHWEGSIALALFPFHEDLQGIPMNRPCSKWVQDMKQKYQIPIIDIRFCCRDATGTSTFDFDHGHLNHRGIKTVLPYLEKELIEKNMIQVD
jgi:hypothetical protein